MDTRDVGTAAKEKRQYDPEVAARFRAAVAYSGLGQREAAKALDISLRTIYRLSNAEGPINLELQERVARVTGVPAWFLRQGFEPERGDSDVDLHDQVEQLRNEMDTVLRILRGRVTASLVEAAPEPEGREGRGRTAGTMQPGVAGGDGR